MSKSIVLGGGCFWCIEAAYQIVRGVSAVVSGYAGGDDDAPTYQKVSQGTTGHAEVVKVTYNPEIISLENILSVFWTIHDPTTINRQGVDIGTQYRSIILFDDDSDRDIIDASIASVTKLWNNPITTEVEKLQTFYPAEDYHQNYFASHPEQGYCQAVINPKLTKLRSSLTHLLI